MTSHVKLAANAPIIGLTLDSEAGGGYAPLPWYALRKNYAGGIHARGAVPLCLPHHADAAEHYLGLIDGLVITGGDFDVDPALFGEQIESDRIIVKPERTQFERAMIEGALARNMPMLGICGGEQLLNVMLGGSLIQHIPDSVPNCLEHEQPNPRTETSHSVAIKEGTLLHRITGVTKMDVNSAHHQAVKAPAPGMIVNATAPDGVIEGIEYPDHPFCLGVEWHPEYLIGVEDTAIIDAFLAASLQHRG